MSWGRIELTPAQKKELASIPQVPVTYIGVCKGCGKKLPVGYLAVVTKWKKVTYTSGFVLSKPEEMYCQGCGGTVEGRGSATKRSQQRAIEAKLVSAESLKAIAVAIYPLVPAGSGRGYSSRKLARLARIPYTPAVKQVLRKLRGAGKVQFVEGRWKK